MAIKLRYRMLGAGWAECYIEVGDSAATLTASYLSDPLDSLLEAVRLLLCGVPETHASFAEEPGEYRWIMHTVEPDKVDISILWFEELWGDQPADQGKLIFKAQCRLRTWAGTVLAAAQAVHLEHGLGGYAQDWGGAPFPVERMDQVQRLLNSGAGKEECKSQLREEIS